MSADAKNSDQKIKLKLMNFSSYVKLTRLHQPTGIWLLFLPCLFGIFLAIKKLPVFEIAEIFYMISLFLVGSIIMRSAGCVMNDLADQKFDEKVARTKNRPLAAGEISRRNAWIFLGILLLCGLIILLQFNVKTIYSGFCALALVASYPLMKRLTFYPQFFLGLTFNFGIIISSFAILGAVDDNALILYFAAIIWTIIYDTIYAFQDIEDDMKIGVKSTAIKFRKNPKTILLSLSLIMFLALLFMGWKSQFKTPYFIIVFLASLFLSQKIKDCDLQNSQNCLAMFKANIWVGILIAFGILFG